jgi:hypothetical protein|tara:strand:+ start:257 stop:508 length:252 start_codon:yes stop_codon:yes gene_type:complete
MKKRTRSILEELNTIGNRNHSEEWLGTTGQNIIESSINLLGKIHELYDEETAVDLERRFINSIRSGNPKKYKTGIDKIMESKR